MPQPDPIAINPCFVKGHSQWADVAFSLNPKKAKTSIPLPRRPTARPPQLSGTHTTARGERRGGEAAELQGRRAPTAASHPPDAVAARRRLPLQVVCPPPTCRRRPAAPSSPAARRGEEGVVRRRAHPAARRCRPAVAVSARPALCGGGKEERGEREGKVKEK